MAIPLGLSYTEAKEKLSRDGYNRVVEQEQQSALRTFLAEFKSPLVLLLLGAASISFISGSYTSATLIIVIIIISSVIDFWISHKSERAAQALAEKIAQHATVVREGRELEIPVEYIVPGDIVVLEAGSLVPADGIVVDGTDVFINESSLTGESLPAEKVIGATVYLGSGVVTGHAYIEVTATGKKTKFYEIVALLASRERPSSFEAGIKTFSFLVAKIALIMAFVVFGVNAVLNHGVLESLIFALAIAVGVTPELLPMIIAFNLSRASIRMAENGVIVKRLSAIENFGSIDILCTDKTGTLTEDKIAVVKYLDIHGNESLDVLKFAYLTSAFHSGVRNPLNEAIVTYRDFDLSPYKKVEEVPFDFERRRDSIVVSYDNGHTLIAKGAPEHVFPVTTLSALEQEKAKTLFTNLSAEGYRVLAVASKRCVECKSAYGREDERDLVFAGFIAFIDPPKEGVKPILDELKARGIAIKIITGDHPLVAERVAKDVGLVLTGTLTAEEVDLLTDEALQERALRTSIFARVTPVQKNRIISALQAKGHVVGYMGDGINDAPALRSADVGISVSNAVDVAREAADIILTTKSLKQLVDGVTEGRRTFANTTKYITMAVSSNFGNMFSMVGASIFLPFLPMLPAQVLLNNLLYESSQFSLGFDRVEESILNKPNPWNIGFIKKFMVVFGSVSSIFDFLTFFLLYKVFELSGAGFQTGWFIESFATQVLVIFIIRSHKSIFAAIRPRAIVMVTALAALLGAWTIALSGIGSIFGFTPLPLPLILVISGIVVIYLFVVEIVKYFFYRNLSREITIAVA
jgi:Mg2+-importing ATPase